uniref:CSON000892 protein n=1 Tax=Culicoides sonorensis TaxID=179676 RepID=A0A336LQE8_CULSO
MNYFRSKTQSKYANEKERLIKQRICNTLKEHIEIIILENNDSYSANKTLEHAELCSALEAIFLHGLKESIFSKTVDFLKTSDAVKKPEPSFWAPLMIISHRDLINSIQQKTQLSSDIAYCRAFIRQVLNDNSLSSYLLMISNHSSVLGSYYYKYAFLRDKILMAFTTKMIESMETKVTFNYSINTSLLNNWPNLSLELAGIWSEAKKSCQIDNAEDAASSLPPEEYAESSRISEFKQFVRSKYIESSKALSSDEITTNNQTNFSDYLEKQEILIPSNLNDTNVIDEDKPTSPLDSLITHNESQRRETDLDKYDLTMLIKRYKTQNESQVQSKNIQGIKEIWNNFETSMIKLKEEENESCDDEEWDKIEASNFYMNKKSKFVDLQPFVEQLCILVNEVGLDGQDFKCKRCLTSISIDFHGTQNCSFSGFYFCDGCMSNELFIIPAKVIYNWDFKKYSVNLDAAKYLTEFRYEPFIDFELLNPKYEKIKMMLRLKNLRLKLNAISFYMQHCQVVLNTFKEMLGYREYLYTSIHKYSIADFEMLSDGQFENMLSSSVSFGMSHITSCQLCSQQGFICEICSDKKIIYPFDLENTEKCLECQNLYHKMCFTCNVKCSKCERKRKRIEVIN